MGTEAKQSVEIAMAYGKHSGLLATRVIILGHGKY
jgi:hypothetical protein